VVDTHRHNLPSIRASWLPIAEGLAQSTDDPASQGDNVPDGHETKSTMHSVSAAHTISAEIRVYDKLFLKPNPSDVEKGQNVLDNLDPNPHERQARAVACERKTRRPISARARRLSLPRS
jgi:hypothetical protein